jgi:hypothetical protein
MEDDQLAFLQKCHSASGKILRGHAPTAAEHAALGQLLDKLTPVMKGLEAREAPALVASDERYGRFFR